LEAVLPMHWTEVAPAEQALVRARFDARLASQALQLEGSRAAKAVAGTDEEPIQEWLVRLDSKLDRILDLLTSQQAATAELRPIWTRVWGAGALLWLAPNDPVPPAVDSQLVLRFCLPNQPGVPFECLAHANSLDPLEHGWHVVGLVFDAIGLQLVDELERAAFLAQRLARQKDS
jgi:hypothetical protein